METRAEELKKLYNLTQHPEGGSFAEVYTSSFVTADRAYMGSIYFLLDKDEISHFHQIDCDEIWYYHEGCGMKISVLKDGIKKEYMLGKDAEAGQRMMIVIEKGSIFAAENLDKKQFTFVSCATTPAFRYEGFFLVYKEQIRRDYPDLFEEISYLAY